MAASLGRLGYRLARNPRKYLHGSWWLPLLRTAWLRGRAACLYKVPMLMRSVAGRSRNIVVFPTRMDHYQAAELYLAWKVFAACNLRMRGPQERDAALAIAWNATTSYELDQAQLDSLLSRMRVLNARCTDVRKSTVGRHFRAIFGYSLEVDPYTYTGPIVKKSENNGAHDGKLLHGPLTEVEPGYLYQRLVTYPTARGMAEWRMFIVGRKPVAVYRLYAPADDRFKTGKEPELTNLHEEFSAEERAKIGEFCESIGLDFGNVDVLRDAEDGRIYITDCNNTPTGPAKKFPVRLQLHMVREIARAFRSEYLCDLRQAETSSRA